MNTERFKIISIVCSGLSLALVLLALSSSGKAGRVFVSGPQVVETAAMNDAEEAWRSSGVKGRVLFLFDRRLNAHRPEQPDSPEAYLYRSVMDTTVRKIYHVIPGSAWDEVSAALKDNPFVTRSGRGFRTATDDGIPIYILQLSDARTTSEPVLVNLNREAWSPAETDEILRLIREGQILSDLVVVAGSPAAGAGNGVAPAHE